MKLGDPIFVLTTNDLLVYTIASVPDSGPFIVQYAGSAAKHPYPPRPERDLLQRSYSGEWKLLSHPDWDVIILRSVGIGATDQDCRRLYNLYKQACPIDMFGFKVPTGLGLSDYGRLVNEFTLCRDRRIVQGHRCKGANPGHLYAILQANRLRNEALNLYRQEQISGPIVEEDRSQEVAPVIAEILRAWSVEDPDEPPRMIVDRLLQVPKSIMAREIIGANPEILRYFFPDRRISDLNRAELAATILHLEGNGYTGILWTLI